MEPIPTRFLVGRYTVEQIEGVGGDWIVTHAGRLLCKNGVFTSATNNLSSAMRAQTRWPTSSQAIGAARSHQEREPLANASYTK